MQMIHWSRSNGTVSRIRLKIPKLRGRDRGDHGEPGRLEERGVLQKAAIEDRAVLVGRLEREPDVRERERGEAHRPRDVLSVGTGRPRDDGERAHGEHEADDHEVGHEPPREDLLLGRPRRVLHEARARLAVSEADGQEDRHREVDPQGLEGQERDALGDEEQARSEERADEAEELAHLVADIADEVVVQRSPELDGLDDRREVVVGQDHHGGLLRDLRAGDAHRDADVRSLQRRRVVHAVAGHRDDVALLLEDIDEVDLVLGRDARDDTDAVDLAGDLLVAHRGELGTRDGTTGDAELTGDGLGGDRVVASDHPAPGCRPHGRSRSLPSPRRAAGRRCR